MKVFIADDEKKVCELIAYLIDLDALNMEIIGFAHDGESALKAIQQHKPDIVITDIRMPGLSGLDVIKAVKMEQPNIEFIVISGFKQFDYAKEALQYGVSNYLLKPINQEELNYTLSQIRSRGDTKMDIAKKNEKINDTIRKNQDNIRQNALYNILVKQEAESLENLNSDYFYNLQQELFQLCVLKIDGILNLQNHTRYFSNKLKYLLEYFMIDCIEFEFIFVDGAYIVLFNFKAQDAQKLKDNMKLVIEELQKQQDIFQGFSVTGSLGDEMLELTNVAETLEQAKKRIFRRLVKGTNRIYFEDEPKSKHFVLEKLYTMREKIVNAIETHNIVLMGDSLREIQAIIEEEALDSLNGFETVQFYLETFKVYCLTLRKVSPTSFDIMEIDLATKIESIGCIFEVHKYFEKAVVQSFEFFIKTMEERESKPILDAKEYIRENFASSISLETVATYVGFSSSYFSSLFKKQTGESFSDYLYRKRMEESKLQLRTTRNSVAQICENIGYSDIRNFTKSFKKFTGLNPKDYRKLYG